MAPPRQTTIALVSDATVFSGAERYLAVLVAQLRGERYRFVTVVSDRATPEFGEQMTRAGADVLEVRGLRRSPTPAAVRNLRRELGALRPTLVHVNATDQRDAIGSLLTAALGAAPALATVHLVLPLRARWRESLAMRALGRMERVLTISDASAAVLRRQGIAATVVRNGIAPPPLAGRAQARAQLGLGEADFVVGGIGRLDVQKGWDVLSRAAARVRADRPEAVFVVVGDGPDHAALADGGAVRFVGYRADAGALLSAFDVLAMPSRYEGLPLVALEAMHSGVPIVATPVGGLPELLEDTGVLVPVGDDRALAAALTGLAADAPQRARLADRARRRASEAFGAERMALETAAVYDELARTASSTSRAVWRRAS